MPKVTIDRFLSAVTAGSSCLSEPAAALRGFAKGDSPRSSRSSLSDRNEDSGMNISPMASSSAGGSSTISRSGTAGMVRKLDVMSSPTSPSPLVAPCVSSPFSYRSATAMPSILSSQT